MTKKPKSPPPAPPADGQPTVVPAEEAMFADKITACRQAIACLAIPAPVLDRDIVVAGIKAQLAVGTVPLQRAAMALLFDWTGWDAEEPALYDILTGRRNDALHLNWRRHVLNRDGHACQARGCGCRQNLHAHHIVRWIDDASLRYVVGNGVTLCAEHHRKQHGNMGVRLWEQ